MTNGNRVNLERSLEEELLRCPRCGNENAEGNRFCGMCGASLASAMQASAPSTPASSSPASATSQRPEPWPATKDPVISGPVISGPSILGLGAPAPRHESKPQRHAPNARDALQPSRNLDYLLEDEEEEPKRGWGKLLLILVALILALGFGYLHWKQGGFDWVTGRGNKPNPAPSPATDVQTSPSPAGPAAGEPQASPPAATSSQPSGGNSPSPAKGGEQPAPNAAQPSTEQAVPQSVSQNPSPSPPPQNAAPQTETTDSSAPVKLHPSAPDSSKPPAALEEPAAETPKPRKPTPVTPVDTVSEAERYIYGRGARQDCDRGLRLLKSAAEQANPKAMISLGALYTAGICTPRDLPTAYRWFAMALHKDPNNQALQDDLQSLWSQMTQPERQLAIKLSQ